VTRYTAQRRASYYWGRLGLTFAAIRRKNVVDRFEVGYYTSSKRIVKGAGPSWEIAFDRATRTS